LLDIQKTSKVTESAVTLEMNNRRQNSSVLVS